MLLLHEAGVTPLSPDRGGNLGIGERRGQTGDRGCLRRLDGHAEDVLREMLNPGNLAGTAGQDDARADVIKVPIVVEAFLQQLEDLAGNR